MSLPISLLIARCVSIGIRALQSTGEWGTYHLVDDLERKVGSMQAKVGSLQEDVQVVMKQMELLLEMQETRMRKTMTKVTPHSEEESPNSERKPEIPIFNGTDMDSCIA